MAATPEDGTYPHTSGFRIHHGTCLGWGTYRSDNNLFWVALESSAKHFHADAPTSLSQRGGSVVY
jgi:hypothetical protein